MIVGVVTVCLPAFMFHPYYMDWAAGGYPVRQVE